MVDTSTISDNSVRCRRRCSALAPGGGACDTQQAERHAAGRPPFLPSVRVCMYQSSENHDTGRRGLRGGHADQTDRSLAN